MQSPLDRDRRVHQKEPLSPPKGPWAHEAYSLAQPRPFLIAHLSPYASHSKISGKECRFNACAPIIRLVKKYARPIFAVPARLFFHRSRGSAATSNAASSVPRGKGSIDKV